MTTNQIRELFLNNKPQEGINGLSDLIDIAKYVNVKTKIDDEGMMYYCVVDILELSKSNIEDDTIYNMVNSGWFLSKDKKSIVKYC